MIAYLRRLPAWLFLPLFVLLPFVQSAHAAGQALPMWEIRAPDSPGRVYLLGSVHVCRESCLHFTETVLSRFRQSDALAVELDPDDTEVASTIVSGVSLPDNQTLADKLDPAQLVELKNLLQDIGLPYPAIERIRPVMAAAVLSSFIAAKQGLTEANGVDRWFVQHARRIGKAVRELETAQRQIDALFASEEKEQIDALMQTVEEARAGRVAPYMQALVDSWQKGDLDEVDRLMKQDMHDGSALAESLLFKRNQEMSNKLAEWLSRGEKIFVVIGAAHIAGRDNVAELLARRGYEVRRVQDGD